MTISISHEIWYVIYYEVIELKDELVYSVKISDPISEYHNFLDLNQYSSGHIVK